MRQQVLSIAVALSSFAVVSGAIVGVGLLTAPPVEAQLSAGISGDWKGGYVSRDGTDVNTFDAKLNQSGPNLTGTIVETNSFGDVAQALFLTSTVRGAVRGRNVTFTKTYDGSGGVGHSVSYNGELQANGRRIRGTYDAEGVGGTFELAR